MLYLKNTYYTGIEVTGKYFSYPRSGSASTTLASLHTATEILDFQKKILSEFNYTLSRPAIVHKTLT